VICVNFHLILVVFKFKNAYSFTDWDWVQCSSALDPSFDPSFTNIQHEVQDANDVR